MLRIMYKLMALGFVILMLTGCFKENYDNCFTRTPRQLIIKPFVRSSYSGYSNPVGEAKLYVFDINRRFVDMKLLDRRTLEGSLPIEMNYPCQDSLILVVWGNTEAQNQILSSVRVGDLLDDLRLDLQKVGDIYEPTDIFHGIEFRFAPNHYEQFNYRGEVEVPVLTPDTVSIGRKVSLVNVILTDIDPRYNPSLFTVVIRNVCIGVDFLGKPIEQAVSTIAKKGMDVDGNQARSSLAVLPSKESVIVILDEDGNELVVIDKDENGNDIMIDEPDKEINIEIKGTELEVSIEVVPWGTVDQDTEFGN